jgi:putative tricarboxylic transport membrane protein
VNRADLGFGCFLIALGLGIVVESWQMPRYADQGVNPWSVPGLVPGMLGLVIVALALVLVGRSVRRLAAAGGDAAPGPLAGLSVSRIGLTLVLTLVYAAGLVGHVPFWLATFLFVMAFILAFELLNGRPPLASLVAAAVVGVLVSGVVSVVFRYIFLVSLP